MTKTLNNQDQAIVVYASEDGAIKFDVNVDAKNEEIAFLDKDWKDSYKRQMEVCQWLLRQNGYPVPDTGYLELYFSKNII